MFFGKLRARREARVLELTVEVERLKRDPAQVIGRHVLDEAQKRAESDRDLRAAIETQTDEAISEWTAKKILGLVSSGVKKAVAAEKRRLGSMAKREAELQIEAARAEFRSSPEAAEYLANKTDKLRQTELPRMIAEEHATLHAQALDDLRDEAVILAPGTFLESDPRADKEFSKRRAADLREITKTTRILNFSKLMEGDEIDLTLVAPGNGNEQMTEWVNWSNRTRTDLIERELLLRYTGDGDAFTLIKDSDDVNGLHPMTPLHIFSDDPTRPGEQIDALVEAKPVSVTNAMGDLVVDRNLEVWFADLNGFRVISS